MNLKLKLKIRKFVRDLSLIRGRHTELVTVYVPAGYDLIKIIQHLQQEQGTASNIKDARTRNNVIDSLEKMIQHLRLFKRTPENGLAVFAGNASKVENKIDIQVWSLEPPEPLKLRLYRCDKTFVLDPLLDQLEHYEVYGLIVLERREAHIGTLKGTVIQELVSMTSDVPGKTRAGGQCLLKNSVVQIADGSLLPISQLHNPFTVKSVSLKKFSLKDSPITDKWNVRKPGVYKITTQAPRIEIESSKDHIFFIITPEGIKEKSAEDLTEDDCLIMPEKISVKGTTHRFAPLRYYNSFKLTPQGRSVLRKKREERSLIQRRLARKLGVTQTAISLVELGKREIKQAFLMRWCHALGIPSESCLQKYALPNSSLCLPSRLDPALAQILGYYLGDGNPEKERLAFSEQHQELAQSYQRLLATYFKANTRLTFRAKKGYHQLRVYGKPLVRFFQSEFPEATTARASRIPQKILTSKDRILAAFLRGLFDAEGFPSRNQRVGLGVNNKLLAQQLQMALLRFGILSSLLVYNNRRNKYSRNFRYTLDLSEKESLLLFKKHIGFTLPKKMRGLDDIISLKSDVSRVRQFLFPGSYVRRLIEGAGYNLQLFPRVNNFFRDERGMSKKVFRESLLSFIKDKQLYHRLKRLHDIPLLPVRISHIERKAESAQMVDLSVKNQNFIANCLLVHNSAARFARIREGAAKEFYKRIGLAANKIFLEMKELKGIIIGGPGPTKEDFFNGDYLNNQIKVKVLGLKDLGYTGLFGMEEMVEKSQDLLAKEEILEEKAAMNRFFEYLKKEPEKAAYGKAEVEKALTAGAVSLLLLSETLAEEDIEHMEELATQYGTEIRIVSTDTNEGAQLRDLGGYAAILRYAYQ